VAGKSLKAARGGPPRRRAQAIGFLPAGGQDWAEKHHDIALFDADWKLVAKGRIKETVEGFAELTAMLAEAGDGVGDPIPVAIETPRGLLVAALRATGRRVYPINPMAVARYRERHVTSGAKSDPGDAKVLADLVRTDRQHHRPLAGDSQQAEAVKVLARTHQMLCWMRGRQHNQLRNTLREFYPGALEAFEDLTHGDALAVLELAPTPSAGRGLSRSKIASALRRGGRQRNVETKAEQIQTALRAPQLEQPPLIADAFGVTVKALVTVLAASTSQVRTLESELEASFGRHPAAEIVLSQPGLATILGARVLAEFGDDPTRYANPKARKNYAGTSPLTIQSGKKKTVHARYIRNRHLIDALHTQAFAALTASPGARAYYDELRAREIGHEAALRRVAGRLTGVLHGCVTTGREYDEATAWSHRNTPAHAA